MTVQDALHIDAIDEKEAAIIDAARETFLSRGFDAASMDAIAMSAGVSKRTVYNRFRSKEDLFAAAILETCRRILPLDIENIEQSQPTEEFIRTTAITFLRGVFAPESIALRRIAAFESARKPALGRSYLEHGPRWMARNVAPMLARAAERGELDISDPEQAVWQLGALITEPLYTEILMGDDPEDRDAAIERQIDRGLAAFFKIYGR
ncbi:MAG: TetR/AcrR family transcriptional regulator [Pseudomonadota bacterium]